MHHWEMALKQPFLYRLSGKLWRCVHVSHARRQTITNTVIKMKQNGFQLSECNFLFRFSDTINQFISVCLRCRTAQHTHTRARTPFGGHFFLFCSSAWNILCHHDSFFHFLLYLFHIFSELLLCCVENWLLEIWDSTFSTTTTTRRRRKENG